MSKIKRELEKLMRSIRTNDFKHNTEFTKRQPKAKADRVKSDAKETYRGNGNDISDDRRPVELPDPYQVQVDKINENIKKAKALSERDMREIEETLARQDIQKEIFRSRMIMRSDEAKEQQKYHSASEDRKREQKKLTAKEKFLAALKGKDKDREHER